VRKRPRPRPKSLWRDALIVTGCAAVVGVILGVMIKRLER
jgi:hypothetical protein